MSYPYKVGGETVPLDLDPTVVVGIDGPEGVAAVEATGFEVLSAEPDRMVLRVQEGADPFAVSEGLSREPGVRFAEPDFVTIGRHIPKRVARPLPPILRSPVHRPRTMLLRRSLAVVSLVALTACATPYPQRYTWTGSGGTARGALSATCTAAIETPSSHSDVRGCLVERGAAWERQATISRSATRGAGGLAIVSTAVAIALAAEGDPNHAVVPLGLTSGAAVTGATSYASPEQASVAEKAAAAYNCLVSAVAEWAAGDNKASIAEALETIRSDVREGRKSLALARSRLEAQNEAVVVSLRRVRLTGAAADNLGRLITAVQDEGNEALKALDAKIAAANEALDATAKTAETADQQVKSRNGMPGARLLAQSDEIDRVAIGEITRRELTARAVAMSARQSIQEVASAYQAAAGGDGPAAGPGAPGAGAPALGALAVDDLCATPDELKPACDAIREWRQQRAAVAAAMDADILARKVAMREHAIVFDAAVEAHKPADPALGQACVVEVTNVAPLTASATAITLSDDRKGSVVIRGGVGRQFVEKPPEGWSVTLSPNGKSTRADITAPATASGKQTLTFYDGAETSFVDVEVTVPAARPADPAPSQDPPPPGAGYGPAAPGSMRQYVPRPRY